ncbi:phosphotransferase [Phenylobacterium sp.]|uniref:phosphotransferase n=1 Tax=Phenylobacterium sp. TaxID=1871053 RepID=UPI002735F20E|nr:phosphotransferase [Phenylobacterium sp.]MDP3659496.1 phosphotransferase [Phenylobacterium sp.]
MALINDMRLPLTLDEVTPEWLTQALSTRFPGVAIKGLVRDAERAGTSTSARFTLDYESRGEAGDAPDAVYVKGGFDDVMRRRVWAALIQEARFYAELAGELPINIPVAYFSGVDEREKQGVVILEDMTARGVRFGHITDDVTPDVIAGFVEGQAKLHAQYWGDKRLEAYRDWAEPARAFQRYMYREKNWVAVHERFYGDMIRDILPSREFALAAQDRVWAINDARTPVLLHGDCHIGNLYFEADGAPGFMDWQCPFPSAPGHDHAELFLSALSVEDRRASEQELIRHYREVLVASGVKDAPSFDDLFLSYRQNIMHMMGFAVFNPYDMQTEQVVNAAAVRVLQAAADLDMLGAIGKVEVT